MKLQTLFLLATSCLGRLSATERKELKMYSQQADEEIYFLGFSEIKQALAAQKTFLLFLGASWCHNTQRFTPKYLQVQERIENEKLYEKGFRMAKVDCSIDREKFCMGEFNLLGFPTIYTFVDGKLLHEYPYADETEPVYNYIKKLVAENPPDPGKIYPSWANNITGPVAQLVKFMDGIDPMMQRFESDQVII
jgi:thiol-disulfide isomerase/thioredoxin